MERGQGYKLGGVRLTIQCGSTPTRLKINRAKRHVSYDEKKKRKYDIIFLCRGSLRHAIYFKGSARVKRLRENFENIKITKNEDG